MQKSFLPYVIFDICILFLISCSQKDEIIIYELTQEQKNVLNSIPQPSIIAHRGTCYLAPEETEAAMRWARNAGATYLECDLQRTKDGYLVLFHDLRLTRTSDIDSKYPERKNVAISDLTLEELFKLDMGSWFIYTYPSNARSSFSKLDILTLEDLTMISEGYRIQRDTFQKRIYKKINEPFVTIYEPAPA